MGKMKELRSKPRKLWNGMSHRSSSSYQVSKAVAPLKFRVGRLEVHSPSLTPTSTVSCSRLIQLPPTSCSVEPEIRDACRDVYDVYGGENRNNSAFWQETNSCSYEDISVVNGEDQSHETAVVSCPSSPEHVTPLHSVNSLESRRNLAADNSASDRCSARADAEVETSNGMATAADSDVSGPTMAAAGLMSDRAVDHCDNTLSPDFPVRSSDTLPSVSTPNDVATNYSQCRQYVDRAERANLYLIRRLSSTQFLVGGDDCLAGCHTVNLAPQSCTCKSVSPCDHVLFVVLRVVGAARADGHQTTLDEPCHQGVTDPMTSSVLSLASSQERLYSNRYRAAARCGVCRRPVTGTGSSTGSGTVAGGQHEVVHCGRVSCPRLHRRCVMLRQQHLARASSVTAPAGPASCPVCDGQLAPLSSSTAPGTRMRRRSLGAAAHRGLARPAADSRRGASRWNLALGKDLSQQLVSEDWRVREAGLARFSEELSAALYRNGASGQRQPLPVDYVCAVLDVLVSLCADPVHKILVGSIKCLRLVLSSDVLTGHIDLHAHANNNNSSSGNNGGCGTFGSSVSCSGGDSLLLLTLCSLMDALLLRAADAHTRSARLCVAAVEHMVSAALEQQQQQLPLQQLPLLPLLVDRVLVEGRSGCDTRQWRAGRLAVLERLLDRYPGEFAACSDCPCQRRRQVCTRLARLAGWAVRMATGGGGGGGVCGGGGGSGTSEESPTAAATTRWRQLLVRLAAALWRVPQAEGRAEACTVLQCLEPSLEAKLRRAVETAAASPPSAAPCCGRTVHQPDQTSQLGVQSALRPNHLSLPWSAGDKVVDCSLNMSSAVSSTKSAVYAAATAAVADCGSGAGGADRFLAKLKRKRRSAVCSSYDDKSYISNYHQKAQQRQQLHEHHQQQQQQQSWTDSVGGSSPVTPLSPTECPVVKKPHMGSLNQLASTVSSSASDAHDHHHDSGRRAVKQTINDDADDDDDSGLCDRRSSSTLDSEDRTSAAHAKPPIDEIVIYAENLGVSADGYLFYTENVHWVRGRALGSGAFSVCHQALDRGSGRLMAVKQLPLHSTDQLVRATDELQLLIQLHHPRLLQLLIATRRPDRMCLFVDWEAGGSVQSLLDRFGAMSADVIRRYAAQLLQALAYLHDNRLVHRDLKGANLLVDQTGNWLKVADLGSAVRLAADRTLPGELRGQLLGTLAFMAPEVVRGGHYGRASDIWSVGCCVIEMATGRPPWHQWSSANFMTLLYKIAGSDSPPELPADLCDDLRELVLDCHRLDQRQRPRAHQLLHYPCFKTVAAD